MERFTTDTPQSNTSSALNLFYIKDGETWVRGGGPEPNYADVRLYDYIREVVETLKADIDDGLSDDDLGECLYELLADGNSTMEGVVATLYMAAWAFSSLRAKLAAYEDTGLEPEEVVTLKDAEQKRREGCKCCNDASFRQYGEYIDGQGEAVGVNNRRINCGRDLREEKTMNNEVCRETTFEENAEHEVPRAEKWLSENRGDGASEPGLAWCIIAGLLRCVKKALRRTAEYDKAREDGRLVELPQDGMLYHIEEVTETGEKWVGNKPIQKITFTCGHGLVGIPFDFSQIGKTVFLTRRAAEAALGGGEGG